MKTIINYNPMYQFHLAAKILIVIILLTANYIIAQNIPVSDIKEKMGSFLKHATHHGLLKNAIPTKLAQALLNDNGLWVGKCPICDQVKHGFRMYLKNEPPLITDKLDEKILKGLKSKTLEKRKAAMKLLIDLYVQQYFVKLDMSEEERKTMEKKLLEGRKTGMERANGGEGFYCSSCDGACHVSSLSEGDTIAGQQVNLNIALENTFFSLDKALANKKKVLALDLSGQELSELPTSIGELTKLKYLNLSNNELGALPSEISNLPHLEELDFSHNKCHHIIMYQIEQIKSLKKLNLSYNNIMVLPGVINQLTELKSLDLRSTGLSTLPDSIGSLKHLEWLCLNDNPLEDLPETMRNLSELKELQLSNTNIMDDDKLTIKELLPNCTIIYE